MSGKYPRGKNSERLEKLNLNAFKIINYKKFHYIVFISANPMMHNDLIVLYKDISKSL